MSRLSEIIRNDKFRRGFWRVLEIICYVVIISTLVICFLIFKWGHELYWRNNDYVADGEYLGNLGDFTAGTVGSLIALLSVFLLYRTLRLQSIANRDNRTLLEVQRFNDLYFNLIGLLDKAAPNPNDTASYCRQILQAANYEQNFNSRMAAAIDRYRSIYSRQTGLASYFRILYRILDLIATSEISDNERVKYSKILRARFSEDELFLMRYNSLTSKGHKLGRYLWDYHILKHLPATDTAEMAPVVVGLNADERSILDRLYEALRSPAAPCSKHNQVPNTLSGPFLLTVRPTKTARENPELTLSVGINIIELKESRERYPKLAAMTARQAEDLVADMVELFNSFAPHSHAVADLHRHRERHYLTLLSVLIASRRQNQQK